MTFVRLFPTHGAGIDGRRVRGGEGSLPRQDAAPRDATRPRSDAGFAAEINAYLGAEDHVRFLRDLIGRADLGPARRADLLLQMTYIADRAGDPRLRLAIVGEFSSGKSTFINAIVRRRLLKSAHRPTTAAATYLSYGETLRVEVEFRDGSRGSATEADTRDLSERLATLRPTIEHDTPLGDLIVRLTSDRVVAASVARVDVAIPSEGLRDGLTIIDTPGIHAAGEQGRAHAAVTDRVVREEADAAVVLIPADAPMTRSLLEFLQGPAKHFLHRCVFVISKADHAPEEERESIRDFVAGRLAAIVGRPVEVTETAAVTALPTERQLPAHIIEDWSRWRDRFASMEARLAGAILRRRAIIVSERLIRLLQDVLRELQSEVEARRARLSAEEVELQRNSVARLEDSLQQIDVRCRSIIAKAFSELRGTIADHARKLRTEATEETSSLLDAADWGTMEQTVKELVPKGISGRQERFAEKVARAFRKFSRAGDEARALFAGEFEGRYKDLRALGSTERPSGGTEIGLPETAGRFVAAGAFVDTTRTEDLGRGAVGAGGMALTGFAIAGPVGAVVGGVLGLVFGYGWNSDLGEHRRKIRGLLDPEIRSYCESCESEALRGAEEARRALERALAQLAERNLSRYAAVVERLRAAHRSKQQALAQAIQQVDRDTRELGRRREALEEARRRFEGDS